MIQFTKETCGDLDAALRREWLETNGLGGFASSTIVGLNTRRYHGLLVAATKPPVGRVVMLSKLEETFFIEGQGFDLSANQYPGVIHPQGFKYLKQFRLDPFPVFTYEIEGIEIASPRSLCHCLDGAWSVAEVLRTLVEDVNGVRPMVQPEAQAAQTKRTAPLPAAMASGTRPRTGNNP